MTRRKKEADDLCRHPVKLIPWGKGEDREGHSYDPKLTQT